MIVGIVNDDLEPVVMIRVIGPYQTYLDVDAIVDTAYTGALALPADVVTDLDLIRRDPRPVTQADGSQILANTYDALIEWDGAIRPVTVSTFGPDAVIGMRLLESHELRVEAVIGGAVEIRPLAAAVP